MTKQEKEAVENLLLSKGIELEIEGCGCCACYVSHTICLTIDGKEIIPYEENCELDSFKKDNN